MTEARAGRQSEPISRRTKEALAAARARGLRLCNPNGAAALRRAGQDGSALRATVRHSADTFARSLASVVTALQAEGHTTLRALAAELNTRSIATRR